MQGLHEIVAEGVTEVISGKAGEQYKAVRGCESATVLMALTGLISLGCIGVGKVNAVDGLWMSKKAADAMPKMISELNALLDPDDVLDAVKADAGEDAVTLPEGFTALPEWAEGVGEGLDPDGGADEAPAKRETLAELRGRATLGMDAEDSDGLIVNVPVDADWFASELAAEQAHEAGERKGPVKWLTSQISKIEKAAERADAKAKAAGAKAEAKAGKDAERAEKKEAGAVIRAEKKAAKAAEREAGSKFNGLMHLPDDGDPIDLEADRECPKCEEVKPVGDGFGVRVMRRIVMHDTGAVCPAEPTGDKGLDDALMQFAGQPIFVQAVKVTRRNQTWCKTCRGKKAAKIEAAA